VVHKFPPAWWRGRGQDPTTTPLQGATAAARGRGRKESATATATTTTTATTFGWEKGIYFRVTSPVAYETNLPLMSWPTLMMYVWPLLKPLLVSRS
jgi:hypothetical protein